ncbi:hypothetical protein SLEP1_g35477 [Rubroshorea leprosula]|uniref:Uncharacterized protein n=1 Tax=Rubroshorea leprosula TaxID=152421 RepID=A0AAV5KNU1_9ROSI|nr:hypothetical protein SLEP1_g35477 [Rubroshorea leprosula]
MAGPSNVNLTIMRLLYSGTMTGYNVEERLDNDMVNEFRVMIIGNNGAMYIEKVAMEGSGAASTILSMESNYQLIVVERWPENLSPLRSELTEWNEHRELWTVGDLLASTDFLDDPTILGVLQHYIPVERMMTMKLPLKSF